jgi:hypothetical protein
LRFIILSILHWLMSLDRLGVAGRGTLRPLLALR